MALRSGGRWGRAECLGKGLAGWAKGMTLVACMDAAHGVVGIGC